MTAPELKSCPFCGFDVVWDGDHLIRCEKCGASSPFGRDETETLTLWNTRTDLAIRRDDPAIKQVVEAAFREGHLWGRCGGSFTDEDDHWTDSVAITSLRALTSGDEPQAQRPTIRLDDPVFKQAMEALEFYALWEMEQLEPPTEKELELFQIIDCPMPKAFWDAGEKARTAIAALKERIGGDNA